MNLLVPLLPFGLVAAGAVLVMLQIAFVRRDAATMGLTLASLGLAFLALFANSASTVQVTPLLQVDGFSEFFTGLILAASAVVILFAAPYLALRRARLGEFSILLLVATLGAMVLVATVHFASLFLGVEVLSVSLYALIAYLRPARRGVEAGVKYLVLGATSSSFLLFGMALVYAVTGSLAFTGIASSPVVAGGQANVIFLAGVAMIVVGLGFKLAVVPFHLWTPDVYEGAPAPVTAFIATVSKGAVFALLIRFGATVRPDQNASFALVFTLIALLSMVAGNVLALLQTNVKRILAYSSIAHLGYLLVAFLASGPLALTAAAFYLVSYFVTTLGAFGIVTLLSPPDRDADAIQDYRGLFWRQPATAAVFTAMLFSLAGIPLTSGFVGKFLLVTAGVGSTLWLLVLVLVLTSAMGLFYYLRIIVAMFDAESEDQAAPSRATVPLVGGLALAGLTLGLVWIGVYPAPLIQLIQGMVARLV